MLQLLSTRFLYCDDDDAALLLDNAGLSQQQLMELVVANVPQAFTDAHGNHKDIAEWNGVTTDAAGRVTKIEWHGRKSLGVSKLDPKWCKTIGFLDLRWVPSGVAHLEIDSFKVDFFDAVNLPRAGTAVLLKKKEGARMGGRMDTENLPAGLQRIEVSGHALDGTLDLRRLPARLEFFGGDRNCFTGTIDLLRLPKTLTALLLSANSLEGPVNVTELPESLSMLSLHSNAFTGRITLPLVAGDRRSKGAACRALHIWNNRFRGALRYSGRAVGQINGSQNQFSSIDWRSFQTIYALDASENAIDGSLDIGAVPPSIKELDLHENALSGTVDLRKLSAAVEFIDLAQNKLRGVIEFGEHVPMNVYLQNNAFRAIQAAQDQNWTKLKRFDASNNSIAQGVVTFGQLSPGLRYINLKGNEIGVCHVSTGKVSKSNKLFYDNGTDEQKGKVRFRN